MHRREIAGETGLLKVTVGERNNDNFGTEDKLGEVDNAVKIWIRPSVPDVEPVVAANIHQRTVVTA